MSPRQSKRRIFSLLLSLVLAGLSYYASTHPSQTAQVASSVTAGTYRVTEIADGDTISVDMNGKIERVRFIGVDTPETHDPRKPVQCFGELAAAYTKQLIGNKPVRLEADSLSTNRDRYNRLLRYVYNSDNQLVQAEIIKNGYGFAYLSFPFSKLEQFHDYEKDARAQNRGLWAGCTPYLDPKGFIHSNNAI